MCTRGRNKQTNIYIYIYVCSAFVGIVPCISRPYRIQRHSAIHAFGFVHLLFMSPGKGRWHGLLGRAAVRLLFLRPGKGGWQGLLGRAAGKGCWQGLLARAPGKDCWQGLLARAPGKGCRQGLLARTAGKGFWQGLPARAPAKSCRPTRAKFIEIFGKEHKTNTLENANILLVFEYIS